ncbi:hypothetical protein BABA_15087 [Neobacillus bataviensis LMG 21833]|uniref:Acyltransferase 3 domain-containing protein n=1 Tax=Neobacillus bataviensis LMG 21833 TaxID=1117379 RepID=K6C5N8_9BACI|nr:acyltransferase [Neobacillus bataviensis]EKN66445.1 hypothetical protein BABA_15087 [Neobacillus bataviensis LMG 21833]
MKSTLYSLQYIRGIAATFVLLLHATSLFKVYHHYSYLNNFFRAGYMGVDIFFVLSGFIIYFVHRPDIGNKEKLKPFLLKRFIRVYPVYWVVLLVVTPLYFLIPSFGEGFETNPMFIIKSWLLIPDIHFPILNVAWSLRHEVLFYIIFGLILIFNKNRKVSYSVIALWLTTTCLLFIFMPRDIWEGQNIWIKFLFNPYNIDFALGSLAAHLFVSKENKLKNFGKLSLFFGLIWFAFSWYNQFSKIIEVHRIIAWGIPAFFIIFGLVSLESKGKLRHINILFILGNASYSIYLINYISVSFLNKIFNYLNLYDIFGYFISITLCVIITLIAGCILHYVIEMPLIKFIKGLILERKSKGKNNKKEAVA